MGRWGSLVQIGEHARWAGEGLRRLGLALGTLGAVVGGFYAKPKLQAVQEHGWHYEYFLTEVKAHPKGALEPNQWEVVLTDPPPPDAWHLLPEEPAHGDAPSWTEAARKAGMKRLPDSAEAPAPPPPPLGFELGKTQQDGDSVASYIEPYRRAFPKEWAAGPTGADYAWALLPILLGFLVPWVVVRAAGWVIHGFQIDRL